MKVFVSMGRNNSFLVDGADKYIEDNFETVYLDADHSLTSEEFKEKVKDFDAVITGWGHTKITGDMLVGSKVKVIASTAGSVASLVDETTYSRGVTVLSGNRVYAESVAEGTIAYMLSGLRRIPYYVDDVKKGGWRYDGFFNEGLLDQTVGIIGLGMISRFLIEMLKPFRAKIKIYSSYEIDKEYLKLNNASQVSLEEVFSTCKIVSLHSSLTDKTKGMIGKEHFDMLSDGSLFINTARGHIVREEEMIQALEEKRFSAVLDVFCKEPLDADSKLRSLDNVYCIPHMGGPTLDRRPYVTKALVDGMLKVFNGEKSELEIDMKTASRMTVEMEKK